VEEPVDVTIRIGGKSVRIRISDQGEPAVSRDPPRLRAKDRALVAAATDRPVSRKRLISLARQPYNSDSRAAVARLINAGHLVVTSGGVRLGKPLPDPEA
jgi:hypothetical protein